MLQKTIIQATDGRVADDWLAYDNRYKDVHRELTILVGIHSGTNIMMIPRSFKKAHVINRAFSDPHKMNPVIENLTELGVKCSLKDPDGRKFEISLGVTFAFVLKHLGEQRYYEAIRMSKGKAGNPDLGIEARGGDDDSSGGDDVLERDSAAIAQARMDHGQASNNGAAKQEEPVVPTPAEDRPVEPKQEPLVAKDTAQPGPKNDSEILAIWDKVRNKISDELTFVKAPNRDTSRYLLVGQFGGGDIKDVQSAIEMIKSVGLKIEVSFPRAKTDPCGRKISFLKHGEKVQEAVDWRSRKGDTTKMVVAKEKKPKTIPSPSTPATEGLPVNKKVRVLVKYHKLPAPGSPGSVAPVGVVASALVLTEKADLAREVFSEAGLFYNDIPSKKNPTGAVLFRFFENPEAAAEAKAASGVEEKGKTHASKAKDETRQPAKQETPPPATQAPPPPEPPAPSMSSTVQSPLPKPEAQVSEVDGTLKSVLVMMVTSLDGIHKTLRKHLGTPSPERIARLMAAAVEQQGMKMFVSETKQGDLVNLRELSTEGFQELLTNTLNTILTE